MATTGDPNVTRDPDGNLVLEWWHGHRKVTLYFEPDGLRYIRVWGPDVELDMADGIVGQEWAWDELWRWLNEEPAT